MEDIINTTCPTVEKETEKVKNPKRVEAGKRLAEISKQAMLDRKRKTDGLFKVDENPDPIDNTTMYCGVGLGAAILWFLLNPKEIRKEKLEPIVEEASTEINKELGNKLRNFGDKAESKLRSLD